MTIHSGTGSASLTAIYPSSPLQIIYKNIHGIFECRHSYIQFERCCFIPIQGNCSAIFSMLSSPNPLSSNIRHRMEYSSSSLMEILHLKPFQERAFLNGKMFLSMLVKGFPILSVGHIKMVNATRLPSWITKALQSRVSIPAAAAAAAAVGFFQQLSFKYDFN